MGRPRKSITERRSRRLIVRVSDADRAAICANAQKAGLRVSEYVRRMAVNGQIVMRQESAYGMSLAHQLRKIGVNVNQLMPIAHLNGEVPREILTLSTKIEALLDRIINVE